MAFRPKTGSSTVKPGQKMNPYPAVPDSVMKAKSTPATTDPKLKMKRGW
jgi:hypothetical protein